MAQRVNYIPRNFFWALHSAAAAVVPHFSREFPLLRVRMNLFLARSLFSAQINVTSDRMLSTQFGIVSNNERETRWKKNPKHVRPATSLPTWRRMQIFKLSIVNYGGKTQRISFLLRAPHFDPEHTYTLRRRWNYFSNLLIPSMRKIDAAPSIDVVRGKLNYFL